MGLNRETIRASVTRRLPDWRTWKTYIETNKKMFNAELYGIGEALDNTPSDGKTGRGNESQLAVMK